jgi:hypothetical protein
MAYGQLGTRGSMVSVLWQHGPAMLERMRMKDLPWPRFSSQEMLDLIAYLNSAEFRRFDFNKGAK